MNPCGIRNHLILSHCYMLLCSRPLNIHTECCTHACTVVRRDLESQHEARVTCAKIQQIGDKDGVWYSKRV